MTRARRVSGKDLMGLLLRRGFLLVRVKGSHHVLEHPEQKRRVVVPVHANKTLAIGTAASILRDAGLSFDDLD